jgi:hypothetical protein
MAGPAGLATAACGGFFNAPRSSAAAANRGEEDDDRERNDHSEKWPGDAPGVDGDLVDVVLEELFRRRRVAAQLCGGCRSSRCRRALAAQINRIGPRRVRTVPDVAEPFDAPAAEQSGAHRQ